MSVGDACSGRRVLEVAEFPVMLMVVLPSSILNVSASACSERFWLEVAESLGILLILLCATSFGGYIPWEFIVCRAASA